MHWSSSRLCQVTATSEATRPHPDPDELTKAVPHCADMTAPAVQRVARRSAITRICPEADTPSIDDDVALLVKAAAGGNRQAWDALVDRFAPSVWAIARGHRLGYADAADVCQTTWLRLVEHLDRIEQPARVGAWLATTARRESLRVIRLAQRQVPTGDDMNDVPDLTPRSIERTDLASKHVEQVLESLLSQLPGRSQLLLRLLLADTPLSYKDISEALDMPIGSIGPTRARALEQLRRRANAAGVDLRDLVV